MAAAEMAAAEIQSLIGATTQAVRSRKACGLLWMEAKQKSEDGTDESK